MVRPHKKTFAVTPAINGRLYDYLLKLGISKISMGGTLNRKRLSGGRGTIIRKGRTFFR
jgi:hypothetical protein